MGAYQLFVCLLSKAFYWKPGSASTRTTLDNWLILFSVCASRICRIYSSSEWKLGSRLIRKDIAIYLRGKSHKTLFLWGEAAVGFRLQRIPFRVITGSRIFHRFLILCQPFPFARLDIDFAGRFGAADTSCITLLLNNNFVSAYVIRRGAQRKLTKTLPENQRETSKKYIKWKMTRNNIFNNYCYCFIATGTSYMNQTAFFTRQELELRAAISIVDNFRRMYHFDR